MNMEKILIFEPHPHHYEVIISSIYYFKELGYEVDLLVRENFDKEDILCRTSFAGVGISVFKNDDEMISKLSDKVIKEYDFIFFNSMEYWRDGKKDRVLDFLGFVPNTKYGILGIYHNIEMIDDSDIGFLKEKRIFALTQTKVVNYVIPLFAACYFGEIHRKKEIGRNVLYIGLSNDRPIIENNIAKISTSCKVKILGKVQPKKEFVHKVGKKIINLGYQLLGQGFRYKKTGSVKGFCKLNYCISPSFTEMFKEIDECDYVGISMDPFDEEYRPFLTGKTSGSKQIVIGFNKPCIINSRFCESFKLNKEYCITYDGNDLKTAFERIDSISPEEYTNMLDSLDIDRRKLIQETINNLKSTINNCVGEMDKNVF